MLAEADRSWGPAVGRLLAALTCGFAAVMVAASMQHGWTYANDFQWSGARFLLHGTDPYQVLFERGRSAFAMTQFPNYAPLLYVLLLPLGLLSLAVAQPVWALLNLAMMTGAAVLVANGVGLRGWARLALVALFFIAEPSTVTLAAGQQGALALFMAVLAVRATSDAASGAGWGVMLVKYSFAPLVLVAVARRRWAAAGTAVALQLAGVVVFCLVTGSSVLTTLTAPLRAAELTQARGSGDFITLTRLLTGNEILGFVVGLAAGAVLTRCCWGLLARSHWVDALSAGALLSFLVFPHLVYDYCLLLPVAGSALLRRGRSRAVLGAVVSLLWFDWLLPHRLLSPYLLPGVVETLLLLVLALVVLVRSAEPGTEPVTEPVDVGARAVEEPALLAGELS